MFKEESFLTKIDGFGKSYYLSFNKKLFYTTQLGGILTIFTCVIVLILVYLYGKEMYYRENPNVIIQIDSRALRPNLTFNISMVFLIEDTFGDLIPNYHKYVSFIGKKINRTIVFGKNGTQKTNYISENLNGVNCNNLSFSQDKLNVEQFQINNLDKGMCFNLSQDIGGYQNSAYNSYLTISLIECRNTSKKSICASQNEINTFLDRTDIQMTIYFEELNFNAINHDDPINKFIGEDFYGIDRLFCKNNDYFFQELQINDDEGWMTSSIHQEEYQQIDYKKNSFYWKGENGTDTDKCLINNNIYTSEFTQIYNRNYIKIPDLIAKLGGILKILFLVINSFLSQLYNRKMNEKMMKSIFKINISDNEIDKNYNYELKVKTCKIRHKEMKEMTSKISNENEKIISLERKNKILTIDENNNIPQEIKNDRLSYLKNKNNDDYYLELLKIIKKFELPAKSKKKFKKDTFKFSLKEHFCACFFSSCSNDNLKRKNNIYQNLIYYVIEYTDLLNFAKIKSEFEKFKFVLISKTQIALFNLIDNENPLKDNLNNRLSDYYNYSRDLEAQYNQVKEFYRENNMINDLEKRILDFLI